MDKFTEKTLGCERKYTGKIISVDLLDIELADGQHAQDQDPDENVFPIVLSEDEVEDGIRNGTIFDSKTLSAWACYRLM